MAAQKVPMHFDNGLRPKMQNFWVITSKQGNVTSGKQEQLQIEQSNQTLMKIMNNFREARTLIGEMLLSIIVEDVGSREQTVIIEGDAVREDRTVVINKPEVDELGYPYVSNDIQRIRLKVVLVMMFQVLQHSVSSN